MTGGVPLLVDLAGRAVVAVGAGPVAARKIAPLLDAGARVTVVAPDAVDEIRDAAAGGALVWEAREYAAGDLAGAVLAVAATGAADVDDRVVADAEAQATFCVRAGAARGGARPGSAAFLASVRRGDLTIAVSTGGRAPAVSAFLRRELAAAYGTEYGALVALLGELRDAPSLAELDSSGRRSAWRSLPVPDILNLLRHGEYESARELASACLCSSSD